jgi:hypothetical protein
MPVSCRDQPPAPGTAFLLRSAFLDWRRILASGGAVAPTALAARVVVVRIGSSWTNVCDRSSLDATARW